jgi:hypothetical protein
VAALVVDAGAADAAGVLDAAGVADAAGAEVEAGGEAVLPPHAKHASETTHTAIAETRTMDRPSFGGVGTNAAC